MKGDARANAGSIRRARAKQLILLSLPDEMQEAMSRRLDELIASTRIEKEADLLAELRATIAAWRDPGYEAGWNRAIDAVLALLDER